MSDQPGRGPEERLPARRPDSEPAPVDRFAAPPSAHQFALTPERAAGIVRQSGSARWVGFLATLVVVLFVIVYYFYELGFPGVPNTSRLAAETEAQQVTAVERGYNIYQTNCSACHGVIGQGGIGPILNDQMKLFVHLKAGYLNNVLTAGGRYVCGNPSSIMPVWADTNGGPLNYIQIQELIAFLRATNDRTYEVRNPGNNEEVRDASGKVQTFTGWRDPNFEPAPGATPVPACWSAPAGSPAPGGSPAATPAPGATVLKLVASGVKYDQASLEAPADKAFAIEFDNQDAGIPHNVDIYDGSGKQVFAADTINGVNKITYNVPALPAGTYKFSCKWHPNMVGELTVK
jgi:mono/diheme cytochrome c family protein/plastocyanin